MKKLILTLVVLGFLAGFSSLALGAEVAKIGVVSFDRILKESSAGKLTQSKLKAKMGELQKKLGTEQTDIESMSKALERESLVLSPEKKREKEREIRFRVEDLKKMQQEFTFEMKQSEAKYINQIQKDVFEIANALGKEQGFLLIVERSNAGVIYIPAKVDITDLVMKKYNTKVAKKK